MSWRSIHEPLIIKGEVHLTVECEFGRALSTGDLNEDGPVFPDEMVYVRKFAEERSLYAPNARVSLRGDVVTGLLVADSITIDPDRTRICEEQLGYTGTY